MKILLLLLMLIPVVANEKIIIYKATYSAKYNGMDIEAFHQLEEVEPGYFREVLKAKNFFGKIDEESLFRVTEDNDLIPCTYRYNRSLMGISRKESQVFDWESKTLNYKKGDKEKTLNIEPGVLDLITHKLQIRQDLKKGLQEFSYPVISRGKLKQYNYRVVQKEPLETPIGLLNTVKVERVRENSERQTIIWLASDWDYLIVKLEQVEDGDSHQMNIDSATIDSKPVTPLTSK